jgi:hypothetical protein
MTTAGGVGVTTAGGVTTTGGVVFAVGAIEASPPPQPVSRAEPTKAKEMSELLSFMIGVFLSWQVGALPVASEQKHSPAVAHGVILSKAER